MIRLDTTDMKRPMTLPAACEWLGEQTGKVPATSTMWRWTLKGVRGGTRLECFRIGGTTFTTPEMIQRFINRTSQGVVAADVSPAGVEVLPMTLRFGRPRGCVPCRHGRLEARPRLPWHVQRLLASGASVTWHR